MATQLPQAFIELMKPRLLSDYARFEASLLTEPSVSIRLNAAKVPVVVESSSLRQVPWCRVGRYLEQRPVFTLDPLLHAGAYYVQEASSMFLQHVVEQYLSHDALVLDLCAAPGGKSIIFSDWVSEGFLVSNEIIPSRCSILAENLIKWGNDRIAVTNSAPVAFVKIPHYFDAVLVDVPCSGEGMFRKDETAVQEWSEANVRQCVTRGHEILESALKTLKPGGLLVYSTCTFNEQEDEEQVQWLIEQGCELLKVDVDPSWNIEETNGYHFWPHRVEGEGLFMAVLRKNGELTPDRKELKAKKTIFSKVPKEVSDALCGNEYLFAQHNGVWHAVVKSFSATIETLLQCAKVVHWGALTFEEKGKNLIPQQGLALNSHLNREAFPLQYELSDNEALRYLSAETLVLEGVEKGFVLLTYRQVPLGFVKNIGGRCNNLYPNNWRIRMAWKEADSAFK